MLIWAAFIVAGLLCAPLLRWPGFVLTTLLVTILYWCVVGLPTPSVLSYAISFVLIVVAMQIGYVIGLVITAKITQLRQNVAVLGKPRGAARMNKAADEAGVIPTSIKPGPFRRGE